MTRILTAALLAASALAGSFSIATAAPVTDTYTLLPDSGGGIGGVYPGGSGTLVIGYDDSFLTNGSGDLFAGAGLTNVTVTFGTAQGTLADDMLGVSNLVVTNGTPTSVFFTPGAYTFFAQANGFILTYPDGTTALANGIFTVTTPVAAPEPASVAAIAMGLLGLAFVRRRV